MGLRTRLMALLGVAIVAPVVLTSAVMLRYVRAVLAQESARAVEYAAAQASRGIDEMLRSRVTLVSDILLLDLRIHATLSGNGYGGSEGRRRKAVDEVLLGEYLESLYVPASESVRLACLYGRNGEMFNVAYPPAADPAVLERVREIAAEARRSGPVIRWLPLQENFFTASPPADPRDRFVLPAVRAMFLPDTGEYVGTQVFTVHERGISRYFEGAGPGNASRLFVVDGEGRPVAHQDPARLAAGEEASLVRRVLEESEGAFSVRQGGTVFLAARAVSPMTGWITVCMAPADSLSGRIQAVFSAVLLILLAALAGAGAFALAIANGIVRPIRRIIAAMERVESGDLEARTGAGGGREMRDLGRYFNRMVERLDRLIRHEYALERRKREVELDVLTAQINSHFLYNALDSIVWKASVKDSPEIVEMAASIGRLLRIASNRGELTVTVTEELEHAASFVSIQRIHARVPFEYAVLVEDRSILECRVLKLVLQPVIENAVLHGIRPTGRPCSIKVRADREGASVRFSVTDDGQGIPPERLAALERMLAVEPDGEGAAAGSADGTRFGIGLLNVHHRIRLHFGDRFGLSIRSGPGPGTTVDLLLPLQEPRGT